MRKTLALWSILALCMMLTAIVPPTTGNTTNRVWWATGVDYNLTAGTQLVGFVNASPGEVIALNWETGVVGSNVVQVQFYPSIPAMNWSGYEYSSYSPYKSLLYQNPFSGSPPGSAWIRSGGYDVIYLLISSSAGSPTVTFNVTATRDNWTLVPSQNDFEAKLAALNSTISALQNYTSYLNSTMLDNLAYLRDNITGIRASLASMNLSEGSDVARLLSQLDALNASLALTEVTLRGLIEMDYANITGQLQRVNVTNVTNVTNNVTELVEYNDTALWKEIARINATPPVTIVEMNNTTVVNKTEVNPVTNTTAYVNRTYETAPDDVTAVVAASVFGGGIAGMTMGYFSGRRKRNGELTPIEPAEPATEAVPYKSLLDKDADGGIEREK